MLFEGCESIPPQELLLYCDTGDSIAELVYNPMVLCDSGRVSKGLDDANVVVREQRGVRAKLGKEQRRTNNEDYIDPHDEKPAFMRVTPPRCSSDASCCNTSTQETKHE